MGSGGELDRLLAALVEQTRALATRIAGNAERETPCHFCGRPVPLWESLLVMQLAGVPAHVQCPGEALKDKLSTAGPRKAFPYANFSDAVDRLMKEERPDVASGCIDIQL